MSENSVSVTNNENSVINVEISTDTSSVNIESSALYTTAIVEHNAKSDAHTNIIAPIKNQIENINLEVTGLNSSLATKANASDVTTSLAIKANQSTTYTKAEVDTALTAKINSSDATLTKQGNTFNGNSQLIQSTSTGKYPALDGSLITNLTPKGYSHIYENSGITVTVVTAGTYVGVAASNIILNQTSSNFTWVNGVGTCAVAGKYRIDCSAVLSCATASQSLGLTLFKNGSLLSALSAPIISAITAYAQYSSALSAIADFAIGDTIQLAVTDATAIHPVVINNVNLVLQRIS